MMQPTLGQNIRKARQVYGMNQTVLADRVGISKTSLSLIESGATKDPGYSIVRRIAQVLRLRVDDLDPLDVEKPIQVPGGVDLSRAAGWWPWIAQDAMDSAQTPYAFRQVEIARPEWDTPQTVDPRALDPMTNAVGLWWRPGPQEDPAHA